MLRAASESPRRGKPRDSPYKTRSFALWSAPGAATLPSVGVLPPSPPAPPPAPLRPHSALLAPPAPVAASCPAPRRQRRGTPRQSFTG